MFCVRYIDSGYVFIGVVGEGGGFLCFVGGGEWLGVID